jgi:hypothetical protein
LDRHAYLYACVFATFVGVVVAHGPVALLRTAPLRFIFARTAKTGCDQHHSGLSSSSTQVTW